MKTTIDRVLEVLAGKGDAQTRQELLQPDSDASRILMSIRAKACYAHNVDLAASARAVSDALGDTCVPPPVVRGESARPDAPLPGAVSARDGKRGITTSSPGVSACQPVVLHSTVAAATVATVARLYSIQLTGRNEGAPPISGRIEWVPSSDSLRGESHRWWFTLRFPHRAVERAQANDVGSLNHYVGRKVCVTISGTGFEESQLTELHLDNNGDLVSAQEQILLPRSLTEMQRISVVELAPQQQRCTMVSFPLVGVPLPDYGSFERPADFVEAVDREPPDWIFHLNVSRTDEPTTSCFSPVTDAGLAGLVDRLRLRMLEGAGTGYRIEPREFVFGNEPERGRCSNYVFFLPSIVMGNSYDLAIAVGLLAAATGQPVPSWVLCSGGLHSHSLDLTRTSCITRKLRLALDGGANRGYHQKLLTEFYRHEGAAKHLGNLQERTIPGKVGLCFVPTDLDADLENLPWPFAVESIPGGVEALRQVPVSELRQAVDELRRDGMLVAQVPNAFEALGLLGYDRQHPYIQEERDRQAASFPAQIFRVEYGGTTRPHNVLVPDIACQASRTREHWDYIIATQLDELDEQLSGTDKTVNRLQIILDWMIAAVVRDGRPVEGDTLPTEAEHYTADVSVIDAEDQPGRWLRVVATSGSNGRSLPYYIPRDVGLIGRVMRTGKTLVVPDAFDDPDLQAAISSENLLATRYGYESLHRYRAFLRSVSSSLHVPLKRGSQVVGIVSLHCHRHKKFQPGIVRLLGKIAKRAAVEVAFYLGTQDCRTVPLEGPGSNESLARQLAMHEREPEAALRRFCHSLMTVIMRQTGAYRVGIRLLTPERHSLVDQGHVGYWADGEFAKEVFLGEDTAGCHAIKSGKSYYINDTTQAYVEQNENCVPVHYKPHEPEARSHASVLVRHGSHLMGVVGVDWDYPGATDARTRQTLEQLVDRYAVALKAASVDSLWSLVYSQPLATESKNCAVPDFNVLLDAVSHMVGAQQGAIFLRRPETGRYHLVASMNRRDWPDDDSWYEPGEGVTGWVLQYNRPLRIANLTDSSELKAIDPVDPPVWKDKVFDGVVRNDQNWTYLGVPIAVGDEVLGILRLANGVNDLGFSSYEQVIAMAAAAQLAGPLYERERVRRADSLERVTEGVLLARSTKRTVDVVFDALQHGIGACVCAVFLIDSCHGTEGAHDERLVCLASNDPVWNAHRLHRQKGEGICGHVWEQQTSLVYQDQDEPGIGRLLEQEPIELKFSRFYCGICAPLRGGGQFLGTLLVVRENRHALTPADCDLVERIAHILSHRIRQANESRERA